MKKYTTPIVYNIKKYNGKIYKKVSIHSYKEDASSKGEKRKTQGKCSNYRVHKSRVGYVLYEH